MSGQLWGVSSQGGATYSPLLTKEVFGQSQPDMKFHQFVEVREQWGKNAGETFLYDKYGNIDTEGTTLTETSTIPSHGHRFYQSTATLYEWGNSIPFTRKYETLAQVGVRQPIVTALKNDYAKVVDKAVEAEFSKAKIQYVATDTATGDFVTNATPTAICSASLNTTHVKVMVDYMYQNMYTEPWDGDNYMCICSMDAKRGVYDDVEDIIQYTKYPASGEFGRYYDVRFVKTNWALSNAIGASTAYGEAYLFGSNGGPVLEGVAVSMEIIPKEVTDFQRSRGLAWYQIAGYKIFWEGDPDNNVIKFASV